MAEEERHKWLAMVGIGLGVLMATLDISIVNIALPTLMQQLQVGLATVEWVILSYALVITSFLLSMARLGDMIGKKKTYLVGMKIFIAGSLLCGLSPDIYWLIVFRGVQALGGVMMQALGLGIIAEVFPISQRGKALGVLGSVVSCGLALGPPLGGMLISLVGWRTIFLVNVPLGLLAWMAVVRFVPSGPAVQANQHFDIPGAILLFASLTCYALGMTWGQAQGFGQIEVLGLLAIAGFGLWTFVVVENRVSHPIIDLGLFSDPIFNLNLLMGWLCFVILGGMFVLPFYLELVLGYTPKHTGLLLMVVPLSMGLVAPWAGGLSDRYGSRGISLVGLLILLAGCLALSTLDRSSGPLGYMVRVIPIGLGMGLFQAPNNSAIMSGVSRQRLGVTSGLLALSRTLGNTSGLPLMGAVFAARVWAAAPGTMKDNFSQAPAEALVAGVQAAFRLGALIGSVAVGLAAMAWWLERRRKRALTKENDPTATI
jgi:EmrB/QacA subfamily drug resistance transporter